MRALSHLPLLRGIVGLHSGTGIQFRSLYRGDMLSSIRSMQMACVP
jgi:hypothetical protein